MQRFAYWPALLAGAFGACIAAVSPARADDAVVAALDKPALITPLAQAGLMTSITRAGSRLVGVGEHGWILISDDNALSWRQVASPTGVTLTKIVFANPQQGWALGQMGLVLHTKDGGLTWTKQLDGLAANGITMAAAHADITAKGQNDSTTADLQSAEALVAGGPSVPFLALLPLSPSQLLLVGGFGLAMQSNDGGKTWNSAAAQMINPQGMHLYGLAEAHSDIYIAGEQGLLLKGPAGGPYRPLTTTFTGTFFGVLAAPDDKLYVYGLQGTLLCSADSGATWQNIVSNTSAGIDAGIALQDGRLLFGDNAGDLLVKDPNSTTLSIHRASEPVATLAQAADGAIIIGGPFGPRRIALSALEMP